MAGSLTDVRCCRFCGSEELAKNSGLICKMCKTAQVKADRLANPEKWVAYRDRYKAKHPGIHSQHQRKHRYGLTDSDYVALLLAHDNKCAVCGQEPKRPHVDHDHVTGKVRGILCSRCNQGLGMFDDDPQRLIAAIDYLKERA